MIMKQTDIYKRIPSIVAEETELKESDILKSRKEECVDARHILVNILDDYGFTDNAIASLVKITRQAASNIRSMFVYRKRKYFVNLTYQSVYARVFIRKEIAT